MLKKARVVKISICCSENPINCLSQLSNISLVWLNKIKIKNIGPKVNNIDINIWAVKYNNTALETA